MERNSEVREALNHYVEAQREEKEIARRIQEEEEKMLQARRHHYLQSTYQINGVYASSWYPQNEFENRLRSVKVSYKLFILKIHIYSAIVKGRARQTFSE